MQMEQMMRGYLCLLPSDNLSPVIISVATLGQGGQQWRESSFKLS